MNSDTVRLEVNLMLLLFIFLWHENCLHDFEIRSIISLLCITYFSAVLSRVAFLYQCLHASREIIPSVYNDTMMLVLLKFHLYQCGTKSLLVTNYYIKKIYILGNLHVIFVCKLLMKNVIQCTMKKLLKLNKTKFKK